MRNKLFDIFVWGMTAIFIGIMLTLPETVATHWNANWEVDGYGSRYTVLIFALLPILTYYGMLLTIKVDPKRKNFQGREKTYHLLRKFLTLFFICLAIFFFYMTINPYANGTLIIMILFGIMFLVIGNYMPKIPQNYFMGIKTPWTLADEVVWKKTHRIGGYGFIGLGFLFMVCGLVSFEYSFVVIIAGALIDVVGCLVYSYYLFKKLGH